MSMAAAAGGGVLPATGGSRRLSGERCKSCTGKQGGLSMWAVPLSYFRSCGQLKVSIIFRNVMVTSSGWDHKALNSFIVFRTGILFSLPLAQGGASSPDVSPLLVK